MLADGHHRYETGGNYRHERSETPIPSNTGARAMMALMVELTPEQLCVRAITASSTASATSTSAPRPKRCSPSRRWPQPPDVATLEARDAHPRGGLGLVDGEGLAC